MSETPIGELTLRQLSEMEDNMFRVIVEILVATHDVRAQHHGDECAGHLLRRIFHCTERGLKYDPGDEPSIRFDIPDIG